MGNNEHFYNMVYKKYHHVKTDYQKPMAPRLSEHKRSLLQDGFPVELNEGKIIVNDRGDLVFKNNNGTSCYYIDAPETITLKQVFK